MNNKRNNTRELFAMGLVALVMIGMTFLFFTNILPNSINEQHDFPLEPIYLESEWENVPSYGNTERPFPWIVKNIYKPEDPISYEGFTDLYDEGKIIDAKYVVRKNNIKFYGIEEVIGKNSSYFRLRTSTIRPESNSNPAFKVTGNYIDEDKSIIFVDTNTDIRFCKLMIIIFSVAFIILSIFTSALFLRLLINKNYKPH